MFGDGSRRFADKQVVGAMRRQGRVDPLTVLHHAGLFQQHLCRLMETVRPLRLTTHASAAEHVLPQFVRMQASHAYACKAVLPSSTASSSARIEHSTSV